MDEMLAQERGGLDMSGAPGRHLLESDIEAAGSDALVAAIITAAAIFILLLIVFFVLKQFPQFVHYVYRQRADRLENCPESCSDKSHSFRALWRFLFSATEEEIILSGGIDAIAHVRAMVFGIQISGILGVLMIGIIVPVNFHGDADLEATNSGDLDQFTMANIAKKEDVLALHMITVFVNTLIVLLLLYRHTKAMYEHRIRYLDGSHPQCPADPAMRHSVLITNIEVEGVSTLNGLDYDEKERIRAEWLAVADKVRDTMGTEAVHWVSPVYAHKPVTRAFDDVWKIWGKVETAKFKLRKKGFSPTHHEGCCCCKGPELDSIQTYTADLAFARKILARMRSLWYPVGKVTSDLPADPSEAQDLEQPEKDHDVYVIEGKEVDLGPPRKSKKQKKKEIVDLDPRMALFVTFKEIDQAAVFLYGDVEPSSPASDPDDRTIDESTVAVSADAVEGEEGSQGELMTGDEAAQASGESLTRSARQVSITAGKAVSSKAAGLTKGLLSAVTASDFTVVPAPTAENAHWGNLGAYSRRELQTRGIITFLLIGFLILFFLIPVTFVQGLTSLSSLEENFSWLKPILEIPAVKAFVEGSLPSLILSVFVSLIPVFFELIGTFIEGPYRLSDIFLDVARRYTLFMIVNVFFGSVIAGSVIGSINDFIDDPASIAQTLGEAIPSTSLFFMNFLLIRGLTNAGMELSQPVPVVMYYLTTRFLADSEKQRERIWKLRQAESHRLFGEHSLVFLVGIVFSTIAPFTLVVTFVYFVIFWAVMKINLTLSFAPLIESGGEYWDYVRNRTIVYLAIYHLVMIGLLGLKEAAWEAVVTIIPLVVTPLFNHFILYRRFSPHADKIVKNAKSAVASRRSVQISRGETPTSAVEGVENIERHFQVSGSLSSESALRSASRSMPHAASQTDAVGVLLLSHHPCWRRTIP